MAAGGRPLAVVHWFAVGRLLDLSERRVQQREAKGVIPKAKRGATNLVGAVRGTVRTLHDLVPKARGAGRRTCRPNALAWVLAKPGLADMDTKPRRGGAGNCGSIHPAFSANHILISD